MAPPSIEDVTETYTAWLSQANKLRDEAFRFAEDQFAKELEAAGQLVRCRNATDAVALQVEFASKMATDYFAEGRKMIELFGEMTKEVSSSRKGHGPHH